MPLNANRPTRNLDVPDLFATQVNDMVEPQGPITTAIDPLRYTIGATHEVAPQPSQPDDIFYALFMFILQLQHLYRRLWSHNGQPLVHHAMLQDFLTRSTSHTQRRQQRRVFSQRNASPRLYYGFHPYHQVQHDVASQLDQVIFQNLILSLLPAPIQEWLRRTASPTSCVMITGVYGLRPMRLGSTYAHDSSPHYMIVLCRNTNSTGSNDNSSHGPISLSPIPYTNQSTEARLFVVCYSTPSSPPDMYSFNFPL